MRIPEAGNTPRISTATGAPQTEVASSSSVQPSTANLTASVSISGRLTSLLAELGLEASPAQLEDLAAQIAALGISSGELDREGAIRAVFLHRNSVPLTAALLKAPSSPETPVLFRRAAALLEEALTLLGSRISAPEVRTSVETLARDLENLLGGNAVAYGWLGEVYRDKREESPAGVVPALENLWGIDADGEAFGNILKKSGMGFEWRLLSWYRTGRDPGMLQDLLRGDLKGILFNFLRNLEKSPARDHLAQKLEKHARSLLDGITSRQVNHLLDGSGEQRTIPLVVPAEYPRERMYAGIRAEDHKRRDEGAPGPELFSLRLDVETTRLGPVLAQLRFSGKTASAAFLLKDRRTLALAMEMADEFRGMLRERGYEPGVIRFALAGREETYPAGGPDKRNSLDIQG